MQDIISTISIIYDKVDLLYLNEYDITLYFKETTFLCFYINNKYIKTKLLSKLCSYSY